VADEFGQSNVQALQGSLGDHHVDTVRQRRWICPGLEPRLARLIDLALSLHDVGKVQARSRGETQLQATLRLLDGARKYLPVDGREWELVRGLIAGNPLGTLFARELSGDVEQRVQDAAEEIRGMAQSADMSERLDEFFTLLLLYYQSDVSSYAHLANHVFAHLPSGELMPFNDARLKFNPTNEALLAKVQTALGIDPSSRARTFDARVDFPNVFLELSARQLTPQDVPEASIDAAIPRVQQAVHHVASQLAMPVVDSGGARHQGNYLSFVNEIAQKIDSKASVLVDPETTQAILGYIHHFVHDAVAVRPDLQSSEALTSLAGATEDLEAAEVLGWASPFKTLVSSPGGKSEEIIREILRRTKGGANEDPANSVRSYETAMKEAAARGGSLLNRLAYDPNERCFVEPGAELNILKDFLRGRFSVVAPESLEYPVDEAVATCFSPELELPFLQAQGEWLAEAAKSAEKPSGGAFKILEEALGRAYWQGAKNRFHRAAEHSLDAVLRAFWDRAAKTNGGRSIPRFIDCSPISARPPGRTELSGLKEIADKLVERAAGGDLAAKKEVEDYALESFDPATLLVPLAKVLSTCTDDGVVSHGTNNLLATAHMERGNIIASGGGQGISLYGWGAYVAKARGYAKSISMVKGGQQGGVIEFSLKQDDRANILWRSNHPVLREVEEKAARENREFFEVLSQDYGIDAVLDSQLASQGYMIVLNGDLLQKHGALSALMATLAEERALEISQGRPGRAQAMVNELGLGAELQTSARAQLATASALRGLVKEKRDERAFRAYCELWAGFPALRNEIEDPAEIAAQFLLNKRPEDLMPRAIGIWFPKAWQSYQDVYAMALEASGRPPPGVRSPEELKGDIIAMLPLMVAQAEVLGLGANVKGWIAPNGFEGEFQSLPEAQKLEAAKAMLTDPKLSALDRPKVLAYLRAS
jgi:hypothetical protein